MNTSRIILSSLIFLALIIALCLGLQRSGNEIFSLAAGRITATGALLLAPLWFFGFGLTGPLKRLPSWLRIAGATGLVLPYFVFAAGTSDFHWTTAFVLAALAISIPALLSIPNIQPQLTWRDGVALAIVVAVYFTKSFHDLWSPVPAFAKLFLADVCLYAFLLARKLEGAGYDLSPSLNDWWVGVREWCFYLPFALIIGGFTGFIHFHRSVPLLSAALGAAVVTFLFIAIPEELFFRGILQNLLETRLGRNRALVLASILFGLSHFNHGSAFNWRYVILASIAGIFYGRAWRTQRRIFAAVLTHTAVDVVWSLWFH